jgi:tetratricopeptide (TPR) repeat protein
MRAPDQTTFRSRAHQWSRAAFALGALFASLPIASRIFLGVWGFDAAADVAGLCVMAGVYCYFLSRRYRALPDPARMLDRAMELARAGRIDEAIKGLSEAICVNPRLWQAFQYRGELYLLQRDAERALADFNEAIRLAPDEPHLYTLRDHAAQPAD